MIGAAASISCKRNNKIRIRVLPGHFAMTHSHTNYYVDIMDAKLSQAMACEAANTLTENFTYEKKIDTIVCMDGSDIIGAYMARNLARGGMFSVNGGDIYVVKPENEQSSQMIFRDNIQPMIKGKNVLILCGSVITGKNVNKAMKCVSYYGGTVVGIAAVFSILDEVGGLRVSHLFSREDIPGYEAVDYADCKLCKAGEKIDALANCYGYSRL